jgi:small subunit ribosomal protein S18
MDSQGRSDGPRPRRYGNSDDDRRGGRRGYGPPAARRKCAFCANKTLELDYKKVDMLHNYTTERGKISTRRHSGLCARHQRDVSLAIKRARHLALLPYTAEHVRRG